MRPVVIMGVAGSGKTTVAAALAAALGVPFCEGDELHPAANRAKMAGGQPLDDADRAPWLARVNAWLAEQPAGAVVSCSALKRAYRDRLRQDLPKAPAFVLLDPPRGLLGRRLADRTGHFMPPSLLESQLATLERPAADEAALCLANDAAPDTVVAAIRDWLATAPARA